MSTAVLPRSTDFPPPDERLVMPECGFEIVGGEVVAVSPAHEPHGSQHSKHERDLILATDDDDVLSRWLATVATCTSVAELVATSR